jgi:hypothetical protein
MDTQAPARQRTPRGHGPPAPQLRPLTQFRAFICSAPVYKMHTPRCSSRRTGLSGLRSASSARTPPASAATVDAPAACRGVLLNPNPRSRFPGRRHRRAAGVGLRWASVGVFQGWRGCGEAGVMLQAGRVMQGTQGRGVARTCCPAAAEPAVARDAATAAADSRDRPAGAAVSSAASSCCSSSWHENGRERAGAAASASSYGAIKHLGVQASLLQHARSRVPRSR